MEIAAYHIATQKQWADIVLHPSTLQQLTTLKDWIQRHRAEIIDNSGGRDHGYRALFLGEAGTGKGFSAALLGNELDVPVYRIDLSSSVSKYIGETEKNLDLLFRRAEDQGWILFFDEADALFGKRTEVKDSHDRYANEETSYLLQKIEDYNGLVILATNRKSNIDDAFLRRIHLVIDFPLPGPAERKKLWRLGLAGNRLVEERIDLGAIAEKYPLTPASILHIAHSLTDDALTNVPATATYNLLIKEIDNESAKQSKKQAIHDL